MGETFIRVDVSPGMFRSERCVSFEAYGKHFESLVDQRSVNGDRLRVRVLNAEDDRVLIELPRETFTTGTRMWVSRSMLLTGEDGR
jgi:hypothetical protein